MQLNKYNECMEKRRRSTYLMTIHRQNTYSTSMASPQVCGLGACILQLEPLTESY